MKRVMSSEKGYTLFMALLIVLLFAVMATSLLTVTVGGTSKTTVRDQQVKSQELAEMGVEHLIQQIDKELRVIVDNKTDGMTRTEFNNELNGILNKYSCSPSGERVSYSPDTGKYEACVITDDPERNSEDTIQKVKIQGKGTAGGTDKFKDLVVTVELGADTIPDYMQYAASAFKTKECQENGNCMNGEGNMFIHGGATIEGDLNVAGNLITTNRGHADYLFDHWVDSYFPNMKPEPGKSDHKIVIGGDSYIFTNKPKYSSHINRNDFSTGGYMKVDIDEAFAGDKAPTVYEREPKHTGIDIKAQKSIYNAYNPNDEGVTRINAALTASKGGIRELKDLKHPNSNIYPYYCMEGIWNDCILKSKPDFKGSFNIVGDNAVGRLVTQGNFKIGRPVPWINDHIKLKINKGMYVEGNLKIGNNLPTDATLTTTVEGPIYVNGNLHILGVKGFFNSVIYVDGDVTIEHSELRGHNGGSLIIYATGKINIYNNSLYDDYPSHMHGFFYSQKDMQIYGTGSNIRIHGGIAAPKIVLNSIRGRSRLLPFSGAQVVELRYFEGWQTQPNRPSRLIIHYNSDIIKTYSDLVSDTRVYDLIPTTVVDRKFQ